MFTDRGLRPKQAFTLVELMVATGLAGIVVAAVAMLAYFTSRSFVAATNYTDMAMVSRMGVDNLTRALRQARQVTAFATNTITVLDLNGNSVQYTFDPATRTLKGVGGGQTITYLTGCDSVRFWIYQRTPKPNSFDCYDPARVTDTKVLQMSWACSRQILGIKVNTELMDSVKVNLRNH